MTIQEIQNVIDAVEDCNLKYTIRSKWMVIDIPFGKYPCVRLLIPLDIKGYRLHILFEEKCMSHFNSVGLNNPELERRDAQDYKILVLKKEDIVSSQSQIQQDLKKAFDKCVELGLVK